MKGTVCPGRKRATDREGDRHTQRERDREGEFEKAAHPSSIQLQTNSFSKFLTEAAAFGLRFTIRLLGFPEHWFSCQLVSTCSHTHTAAGGSRSGSRAPAVLLIKYPKVMLKPMPSHRKAPLRCENTSASQNKQIVTQRR